MFDWKRRWRRLTGGKVSAIRSSTSIGSPDIFYYCPRWEKFSGMETQLRARINVKKFNKPTRGERDRAESASWPKRFDRRCGCLRSNMRKQLTIARDLITKFWDPGVSVGFPLIRGELPLLARDQMIQFQRVRSVRTLIEWSNFPTRPTGIERWLLWATDEKWNFIIITSMDERF